MPADRATDDRITVGRVVKPHGLLGEVAVDLLSDVPDRLAAGVQVWVDGVSRMITAARPHLGRLLVTFADVGDRTAAETLRGADIEAEPVDLADSDTYWAHELVGATVTGPDGQQVGVVTALIDLPAAAGYDLLEVTAADGATFLLPAADDLVEAIETDEGLVLAVTDPPEGLLP
ncbi:MAG TPA: ribosome maturation factor RimM [Nitriliruptorales bacterium]